MERERESYMATTWHTVPFPKVQLHKTRFKLAFAASSVTQRPPPEHGSTLKFQSDFPNLLAMILSAATATAIGSVSSIKYKTICVCQAIFFQLVPFIALLLYKN